MLVQLDEQLAIKSQELKGKFDYRDLGKSGCYLRLENERSHHNGIARWLKC